jgi:hypothetical protein
MLFQTLRQLLYGIVVGALLTRRRHHAGAQALDHFLTDSRPFGDAGGIGEFQINPASKVAGVMTGGAVLVDQRFTVHTLVVGNGGLCENDDHREHENAMGRGL